jgi:enoyl-CoA hydratase/carnithine racemase
VTANAEILFDRRGAAGLVTLNRPQALNAVTHDMVHRLGETLATWAEDDAVTRVVLTAAGERAFSAGGDLRAIYKLRQTGRIDDALTYWGNEYRLNAFIKHYRKPYVSLIDGAVMGGGVGISIHGSHRIAGDRFRFAMPECGIGFFPDVGASWFLPRLPGEIGTYVGLTGERLDAIDGVQTGLATKRVGSKSLPDLIDALCSNVPVDAVIGAFAEPVPPSAGMIMARRSAIDRLFKADRIEDLFLGLDAEAAEGGADAAFARDTAALIRTKSPTSLKVTLALLRRGRTLDFAECMRTEFRVASRFAAGHDFYEGIRSVIIDKDKTPRWQPSALEDVSDVEVERHFLPVPAELDLP